MNETNLPGRQEELLRLQRDVSLALTSASDVADALDHLLEAVCQIEGIDCGAAYLVNSVSGRVELAAHRGLSDRFIDLIRSYGPDSAQARLAAEGRPQYGSTGQFGAAVDDEIRREGLLSLAVLPVLHEGKPNAIINLASRQCDEIPQPARHIMEAVAAQVGGMIARVEALEALKRSEERFRLAFEEGPLGIIIGSSDGGHLHVNRAFCEMTGYSEDELREINVRDLTHPDDLETVQCVGRMFCGDIPGYNVEKRYIRKDGRVIWVRVNATPMCDTQDRPLFALAMVQDVSEQRRAKEQVQHEQRLLRRLLDLQDQYRKIIAYEIHDGLTQQLVGARLTLEALSELPDRSGDEARTLLDRSVKAVGDAIDEARRLISGLRPIVLDEYGILPAVSHLVAEAQQQGGTRIELHHNLEGLRLAPPLENAMFRIVQAALSNVCQHSRAKKARLRMMHEEGTVHIELRDWGVGFDPSAVDERRFGLRGIRERARLLGGKASVRSKPDKGTRVRVELPAVLPAPQ